MSLRAELTAEVAVAFDTDLADAVSSFTGSRFVPSGPPDPVEQTQPGTTIAYTGRGVFGGFGIQISEALGILRTDVKLTALQSEVTQTPKVDDVIKRFGEQYTVIDVAQDPVSATWRLQLRRA